MLLTTESLITLVFAGIFQMKKQKIQKELFDEGEINKA